MNIRLLIPFFLLLKISACKKDDINPSNDIGGKTDIPLNKIGNETSAYLNFNGEQITGEMVITANNNGIITYRVEADLSQFSFGEMILPFVQEHLNSSGNLETEFQIKSTSEGLVDYFVQGKPWIIARYDDPVGTKYPFEYSDGNTYYRTITEKTGIDEWPLVFWNIKTTKVETDLPPDFAPVEKMIYRVNHKFGIVYVELVTNNDMTATLDLVPWDVLP
jgi:hypothetical protein